MNIESTEKGSLGIMHLKRFWHQSMLKKENQANDYVDEFELNCSVLSALRMGLEPTIKYLYQESPTFEQFEDWIRDTSGKFISDEQIASFNHAVLSLKAPKPYIAPQEHLLTTVEIDFWNENGYLIIPEAISKEHCRETLDLIFEFLGVDEHDPSTWYTSHDAKQGIMIQLFHHDLLERNRHSPKIKSVFEQLWQRNDLLVNADRVGFNPPEKPGHLFSGPDLHWDVSLQTPIPLGLQGLAYLSDTAENQGAFTLVPGFHNRIESWLAGLAPDANPREEDLHALGSKPLAAKAGDFIVWNQALPHGSSPNRANVPRIVQYINYKPLQREVQSNWI